MRKWIGLLVCVLLFVPPFLWQWTHQFCFVGQMLVGIWTVYHWLLDSPPSRRAVLTTILVGIAFIVTMLWAASLNWCLTYRGRTSGIDVQMGSVSIIKFLGNAEEAEEAATSFFSTRGPGLISPFMWNQRKARLGYWAIPVNLLFSFHMPRGWQQIIYVGDHPMVWLDIPLWTVVALCVLPLAGMRIGGRWRCYWQRFHAKRKGHCRRCGYDLTGNVSGICPECGTSIPEDVLKRLQE